MNWLLIFDVLVFLMGIYLSYSTFEMKTKHVVAATFLPKDSLDRCTDKKSLCDFLVPRTVLFALTCLAYSVFSVFLDLGLMPQNNVTAAINIILLLLFISMWMYFSHTLRKAAGEYC